MGFGNLNVFCVRGFCWFVDLGVLICFLLAHFLGLAFVYFCGLCFGRLVEFWVFGFGVR